MISMQLLDGVLVALAGLVGAAVVLAAAIMAAAIVSKPGQSPHGGIRREMPTQPGSLWASGMRSPTLTPTSSSRLAWSLSSRSASIFTSSRFASRPGPPPCRHGQRVAEKSLYLH